MPTSGLKGPFPLNERAIAEEVSKRSPGAYALGETRCTDSVYLIAYVGRADRDVNATLRQHIGEYQEFKFEYYGSTKAAFEKQCRLYHDFQPPGNMRHPDRPEGSGWNCPVCTTYN